MKTYLVGGSVRDEILGLPVKDRDYVVVGATPDEMVQLGYRPVGKDFPVFLHPESREQYALARTERKVSRGYKGFEIYTSPHVTLQEDLARRDLESVGAVKELGAEGAANILFKKQIESATDPSAERKKLANEYREKFNNPYYAASTGYVDDIIEPRESRPKIIAALSALRDKFAPAPPRKHGNIPV